MGILESVLGVMEIETCRVCGKPVTVQINKGTGICSETCKKAGNMAEPVAKLPAPEDMDVGWNGQFLQHWVKRHSHHGIFDTTHERYPDDSVPLWYGIRMWHDRIHAGSIDDLPAPTDHVHLPRLDPQIQKDLKDIL